MPATYDVLKLNHPRNRVRLLLRDTDTAKVKFQDEEIDWALRVTGIKHFLWIYNDSVAPVTGAKVEIKFDDAED